MGPLAGFNRLRVGGLRIVYRQISSREILLEFASTRDVIYELYCEILSVRAPRR